jgi:hypothetical protein
VILISILAQEMDLVLFGILQLLKQEKVEHLKLLLTVQLPALVKLRVIRSLSIVLRILMGFCIQDLLTKQSSLSLSKNSRYSYQCANFQHYRTNLENASISLWDTLIKFWNWQLLWKILRNFYFPLALTAQSEFGTKM